MLVTLGTDGVTDWVRTPDGTRFNLGPVSVLRFVSTLVPKASARQVLDRFLKSGETLTSVDEERMWELLAPVRVRLSASSSMEPLRQSPKDFRKEAMMTLPEQLTRIERHIRALNEAAAKKASNMAEGVQYLIKLANKIKSPNQSKNETYYGLGAPDVYEVGDKAPEPYTANAGVEGLSYDVYVANAEIANGIMAKVEDISTKIDSLVKAGKRFNASKAKADVMSVTSKVAGILKVDLTSPWVRNDLIKLAARADELHRLFFPKA